MKLEIKSIIYTAVYRDRIIKTNDWREFVRRLNGNSRLVPLNINTDFLTVTITIPDTPDVINEATHETRSSTGHIPSEEREDGE